MNIQFINYKEWGIDIAVFDQLIYRAKDIIETHNGILNVIFINDDNIQDLNKIYRQKNQPTDVLSFNYLAEDDPRIDKSDLIGEIYISIETAKRQAEEYKHSLQEEINKLFVHGLLHIYGYDHGTKEDYRKMSEAERRILN